jgi:excisionase family DNA binding protein
MATTALYFTTGQAARELGVSSAQVRALAESGAVQAESTPGGQWRIPAGELDRLKREGLPSIPRPLPVDVATSRQGNGRARRAELLADPSAEAVTAAESVAIARSQLEKRKIERDLEETEDWFRDRDRQQAERDREDRARLAAEQAEAARTEWLQQAEEYASHCIHMGVPPDMRLEALDAVRARLEPLTPTPNPHVTREIVDATLEVALQGWLRLGDLQAVSAEVRHRLLPWDMRDSADADRWETAATKAATLAMGDLLAQDLHAPTAALRAAVKQPVEAVVSQFRHECRCHKLVDDYWWFRLPDATAEQRQRAKEAVLSAILAQPPGTSGTDLEHARDTALEPYRAAIAKARAEQQAQQEAEARRQQERSHRDSLKQALWAFPWGMPIAEQEQARSTIAKALDALPEGTPLHDLDAARDSAIKPYLDRHAEWKRKEELVRTAMQQIPAAVQKIKNDGWRLAKTPEALQAEFELVLRERISGTESADALPRLVRGLVRKHVGVLSRPR